MWNNSNPRKKKVYLEVPRETGLGLPNFIHHHITTGLRISSNFYKGHLFMRINRAQTGSWNSPILYQSLPLHYHIGNIQLRNPVFKASLRIWVQFRRHFGLKHACRLLPVANNQFFPLSLLDNAFQYWHRNGLVFFCDLFTDYVSII